MLSNHIESNDNKHYYVIDVIIKIENDDDNMKHLQSTF